MKIKDILIIVGLIVSALTAFLVIEFTKEEGNSVVVKIEGKADLVLSLEENKTYELNGGTHTLVIEDGKAYLTHASCPDHVCINQGKIAYNGETITCLPYRLTITVSSDKAPSVELVS